MIQLVQQDNNSKIYKKYEWVLLEKYRVRQGNLAVEAIWRVGDTRTNSIIATTIPVLPNSL